MTKDPLFWRFRARMAAQDAKAANGIIDRISVIFADLELSRRLERPEAVFGARFVEARSSLSPDAGAQWIEVSGVYAMFVTVHSTG